MDGPSCWVSYVDLVALWIALFVGDDLAEFGDVFLDAGDLVGPGAVGVVRVGESGGVLAFGFGEVLEEMVELLLEGGAGHGG